MKQKRSGVVGGALAGVALAALETGVRYVPSLDANGGTFEPGLPLAAAAVYIIVGCAAGAVRWWLGVLAPVAIWAGAPAPDLTGAALAIAAGCLGWLGLQHPRVGVAVGGALLVSAQASSLLHGTQEPEPIARASSRPDVLLVVLDTVGARFTSLHGYELDTTPTLTRLAAEGVWFQNAVAPAPWTVPSHGALFTGKPPRVIGCHHENPVLKEDESTLAETFAAAGYRTGAFVANPFVGEFNGLTQGFEHEEAVWKLVRPVRAFAAFRLGTRWLAAHSGKGAALLVERVLAWWDQADDRPAFVFVNLMEAHSPFHQVPVADRYGVEDPRRVGDRTHLAQMQGPASIDYPEPGEVEASQRLHAAGIRYLDDSLGTLIEALRTRGRLDHTVIAVTADHGEGFGEHGFYGHMVGLYTETLHVPLVIRHPKTIDAGTIVSEPVSLHRLHDTLLALSRVRGAGQSLLSDSDLSGEAFVISEQMRPLQVVRDHRRGGASDVSHLDDRALRVQHGSWVLLRKASQNGGGTRWFFFDLSVDPAESRNRWPDPRAAVLRTALEAHDSQELLTGGELDVPSDLRDQLNALGYMANP